MVRNDQSTSYLIEILREREIEVPTGNLCIGGFGDSESSSNELLALIAQGTKRAGASLFWTYEHDAESLPLARDIVIVVDHLNRPRLITRTIEVDIVPFSTVSAEFVAREGEGDGSLEYWRTNHWQFFTRECARIGRDVNESMLVVCETFELVQIVL